MAATFGKVDYEQLKKMQARFESIVGEAESGVVYDEALREVGQRHLARVVQNTPFGVYPSKTKFVRRIGGDGLPFVYPIHPRKGGTLKKGWVVETHEQASSAPGVPSSSEITSRVYGTPVKVSGTTRSMTFYNRVKYALWVDQGHRLCHPVGMQYGFVAARNFIRKSEKATSREMAKIFEKHMRKALKRRGIG